MRLTILASLAVLAVIAIGKFKQPKPALVADNSKHSETIASALPVVEEKVEEPAKSPVVATSNRPMVAKVVEASKPVIQKTVQVAEVKPVAKTIPKTKPSVEASSAASTSVTQEVTTTQASTISPLNMLTGNIGASSSKFHGSVSVGYSSNLYERDAYESESMGTYSARLDYTLKGANLLRAFVSGYQQDQQGQEHKFNDGFLAWVNNSFWRRGNIVTIGQQVRFVAPMSKESIQRDERLTGVTLAPVFIFNLTPAGLTGVTLVYLPQLTKNFHKYETNRAFNNNTEYSLSNILSLSYSFTDNWYWRNDFVYGNGWSYGGVKRDDNWQFATEIGYTFRNGVNIGGGLTNAGAIRNLEYGNDQTINLFNDRTASVYTDLSYFF